MGPYEYIITDMNGEYAFLKRMDIYDSGQPMMVAIALLPDGVDVGSKLHWENMAYSIIAF